MSDGEPKWERMEPPSFEDDDKPPVKPDYAKSEAELPLDPEAVKEIGKQLFNETRELGELIKTLPTKIVLDPSKKKLLYSLVHYDRGYSVLQSSQESFSGIGDGSVVLSVREDESVFAGEAGFPTNSQLIVRLHTHDENMKQADTLDSSKDQLLFSTRFYSGKEGQVNITSVMPQKLKDPGFQSPKNPKSAVLLGPSPITPSKLELAGAAIQALTARVKSVHNIDNTQTPGK